MARSKKRKSDYSQHSPSTADYIASKDDVEYDTSQPEDDGAHAYTHESQLPWDLNPYWKHRHSMFELYDEGIWTTDDSWFEVTHESIANRIADHVAESKDDSKLIMLDCFAGIGGNAIAFARSGIFKRVYAVEKNAAALACARHNAEIYGVADRITWFHGDCFELLGLSNTNPGAAVPSMAHLIRKAGVIFASPPWGGPGYKQSGDVFDLSHMPYTFTELVTRFSAITTEQIFYLPRTSDLNQIVDAIGPDAEGQVVHYCIHENSKAMCLYLGDWKEIMADES